MAVVRTGNTSELAQMIVSRLFEAFQTPTLIAEQVYSTANAGVSPVDDGAGGSIRYDRQVSDSTISTTAIYTDVSSSAEYGFDVSASGTGQYRFTGSGLETTGAAASGFDWSERFKLAADGLKGASSATGNAQIAFNPELAGDLSVQRFNYNEQEKASGRLFGTNFAANLQTAISVLGASQFKPGSQPGEYSQISSTIVSLEASVQEKVRVGGYSYTGKDSYTVKSAGGLTLDATARTLSGSLDSLLFSEKGQVRGAESWDDHFQGSAFGAGMVATLSNAFAEGSVGYADGETQLYLSGTLLEALRSELFAGDDSIAGSSKQSNFIQGGGGNDTITGQAGADLLFGEDGNDILKGQAGADYLDGGLGNDSLDGGAGNDDLVGGAGIDTLKGGAGKDRFLFSESDAPINAEGFDVIADFKLKQGDKIVFDMTFGLADVSINLTKADLQASFDKLLVLANLSGARVYVGATSMVKKSAFAFADFDDDGSMDGVILLTGVNSAAKLSADSFEAASSFNFI